MNQEHGRSMIFSSLFNDDFLARPFVRQTVMYPWFYLHAEVREGKEFVGEMFMVSSFDSLKDILEQQHDSFRIRSIHYVTPGFVNMRGVRDRALLLLAWSGGGRRRSEVVGLQVGDVRQLDADTWLYALGTTKTDTGGVRREKPLRGPAAQAPAAWLDAAPAESGPLFRRMYKGGKVGTAGLSADQVARIVQRRAKLAGLDGDWAAHSLRSGFVSEAGRQGVPLGEVMAMTEHRSVSTVMGYFQAGSLLNSLAANLLTQDSQEDSDT